MTINDVARIVRQMVTPLKNKIMLSIGRGIISAIKDSGDVQTAQLTLLADEVKDGVEYFKHFGFANNPPSETECVMVSVGGNRDHGIIIATENRDLRLKNLGVGDTALYNKNGKHIWLKGDDVEMLLSKLKIENDSHEMVSVLSEFMQEVIDGTVTTAIGPQQWTPDTITTLTAVKDKLDTFKV